MHKLRGVVIAVVFVMLASISCGNQTSSPDSSEVDSAGGREVPSESQGNPPADGGGVAPSKPEGS